MKNKLGLTIFSVLLIFLFMPPQAGSAQEEATKSPYKIRVGDVLEIITWKEPDFSREEVLVRSDGMITFPLVNDVDAEDRTTMDIKKDIEDRLKDYISNPIVTVTVRTPTVNVKKFYILGEVVNTGEYDLNKELTVLQAFALGGGFTEWASKKEIIVLRNENGKEETIRVNYKNIAKGKDLSQNIKIKANDTIIVP